MLENCVFSMRPKFFSAPQGTPETPLRRLSATFEHSGPESNRGGAHISRPAAVTVARTASSDVCLTNRPQQTSTGETWGRRIKKQVYMARRPKDIRRLRKTGKIHVDSSWLLPAAISICSAQRGLSAQLLSYYITSS